MNAKKPQKGAFFTTLTIKLLLYFFNDCFKGFRIIQC